MEYRLNLEAVHRKMRAKNEVLPRLQERFEAALERGQILQFGDLIQSSEDWLGSLAKELDA